MTLTACVGVPSACESTSSEMSEQGRPACAAMVSVPAIMLAKLESKTDERNLAIHARQPDSRFAADLGCNSIAPDGCAL